MPIKEYKHKRDFKQTSEPQGVVSKQTQEEPLHFCIQKHAAKRLHYDFRLEHKGVLLSWAIPKEPSMDPHVKRLAIMVEDHPLEYRHFEGIIPKGNYGAGVVKIWDEGTFVLPGVTSRREMEKKISEGLIKGHIDVQLFGKRLTGVFSLIKLQNSDNNWLLIKKKESQVEIQAEVKEEKYAPHKQMPREIHPMLATLVEKPFDNEEWVFEVKWDGYRVLSYLENGKIDLRSRNNLSFNELFSPLLEDLKKITDTVILDGEVVILDEKGIPHFQLIQNYQNTRSGTLIYYVFDILYHNGKDLRDLPLIERKAILKNILLSANCSQVLYSAHIDTNGVAFFKEAQKMHLEGIMGKRKQSVYMPKRSSSWVKIKTVRSQEVVIGGYTQPRGARKKFGALLVGVYEGKRLIYAGHVGGGFDEKGLHAMFDKLEALQQDACPFDTKPKTNMPARWVKPKLVCEVSFAEWTSDGCLRQPIFKGLRVDKRPEEVTKEMEKLEKTKKAKVVNLNKVYWPEEGYTKDDLIHYYEAVFDLILPHLKNRPVMLHRYPEGISGQQFYQKDVSTLHVPDYVETIRIEHEAKPIRYMIINNLDALLYAVNLGAIEIHPFLSQIDNLDNPVYMVIDLDPEDISFEEVIDVAQVIHELLDSAKIKSYCKTSGGRGLHICIPLAAQYTFEQAKRFGELIVALVHQKIPSITSLERSPKKRQKKIYLDVYQNNWGQTLVPPYCVRGKPGATVSTPLEWKEVKSGLIPQEFTIKTVPHRVQNGKDLFKPVLGKGVRLESALKRL